MRVNRVLVSLGKDMKMNEYDLETSGISEGLMLSARTEVEQRCQPTCAMWHPPTLGQEAFIIIANKVKVGLYEIYLIQTPAPELLEMSVLDSYISLNFIFCLAPEAEAGQHEHQDVPQGCCWPPAHRQARVEDAAGARGDH